MTPRSVDSATPWLITAARRVGQVLERRRLAEIERQDRPLSLDDAWTGGWYARSRMQQEALLVPAYAATAQSARQPQDWDDKLD
jgi:hypothetical protein